MTDMSPRDFWEQRYAESERIWSGRVNATLPEFVQSLPPGRGLDLGSGEGADVLWLARQGWEALGVELSETAVARAREQADGLPLSAGRARFIAGSLPEAVPDEEFDLVTAFFLQSPVELDRAAILRAATGHLSPGGHLLLVSHAAPPPWTEPGHGPHQMVSAEEEMAALALTDSWTVETAEERDRQVLDPDGRPAVLQDAVIWARRTG